MRRIGVSLLMAALLSTGGVLVATPATACSCMSASTLEFFERADAVFTGTLVSREVHHPEGPIASSGDPALHVFAVDTVLKGTANERQGVVSADFGATCGLELSGNGPFVVFATRTAEMGRPLAEDQYAASLCGGTAPATDDLEAELRALAGPSASGTPERADDGGTAAPPRPGESGDPGLPTAVVPAGLVALVLVGWLFLRHRASSRADDVDARGR